MKNRRSTIIVAIMVALVGTPRVWQEFGNILASLQHKTQNKLLSMAVSSQVRDSDGEEVARRPVSEQIASCPASKVYQIADSRNSVNSSAPRKLRAQRRSVPSSGESSALAFSAGTKKNNEVALPHPAESLAWVGENQLTMHAVASVPPELLDKENVTEFVTLPKVNSYTSTIRISDTDLIKLKKVAEESKGFRQRVRYIISRSVPTLPST